MAWRLLRGGEFRAARWRRQHPIGPFVVDFYSPVLALVLEIDGDIHVDHAERDAQREAYLRGFGLAVARVRNDALAVDPLAALRAAVAQSERGLTRPMSR